MMVNHYVGLTVNCPIYYMSGIFYAYISIYRIGGCTFA
nr:MAG TPA: hypothetical protein [Caudoviricetes sp.]